ncbi:sugar phosphate nucleotidyltransferase [Nocardia sp. GAS34]|uniref:sugar phosphate nucleotidyltransferase n=1 Tax=unclassified Nocardia TaxID=2637762 RepID=UPI003D1EE9C5
MVPAAGLGTRFLPATKTVAKELLPVVDTSGIELVAQEAAHTGADRMVIVTSPGKQGLAAHFAEDPELLRHIEPGAGGEYQLTDAIALLISRGHSVHVVVHRGIRHDIGNPAGYLRVAVDFALQREEYAGPLREWLLRRLAVAE